MQALLILGMHRSYTSLASRWLSACGLDLGADLLGQGIGNRDGHFEDLAFLELHRKALDQAGLQANGMVEIGQPHFDRVRYEALQFQGQVRDEARALIACKLESGQPFAWKEPRTCLFLPFYRRHLDCRSLILFRSYQDVVSSLIAREGPAVRYFYYSGWKRWIYAFKKRSLDRQVAALKDGFLEAWIHYNACLLDHIEAEGPNRVMVHDLASLTSQSEEVIERLNNWGASLEHQELGEMVKPLSKREPIEFEPEQRASADAIAARFEALIGRG